MTINWELSLGEKSLKSLQEQVLSLDSSTYSSLPEADIFWSIRIGDFKCFFFNRFVYGDCPVALQSSLVNFRP